MLCSVQGASRLAVGPYRPRPDSGFLGRDWLGRARAPLSDGLLDFTHPAVLWAPCVSALVSVS